MGSLAGEDGGHRPQDHFQVGNEALALRPGVDAVPVVVKKLATNACDVGVVAGANLGDARDSRLDAVQSRRVGTDSAREFLHEYRPLRTGTHEVHLAAQNVPELRNFIEAALPEHSSRTGDARIVLLGPDRTGCGLGIRPHGPELPDRERPATEVTLAPVRRVGGQSPPCGSATRPSIDTDPFLRIEERSGRIEAHQQGDDREQQRERNEDQQGHENAGDLGQSAEHCVFERSDCLAPTQPTEPPQRRSPGKPSHSSSLLSGRIDAATRIGVFHRLLHQLDDVPTVHSPAEPLRNQLPTGGGDALVARADEPARLLRYANRVPLLYQQPACAIARAASQINWRGYGLQQPKGGLPVAPMAILVHVASVWVPFTSESKEAIAAYPEIVKEIRLGLQACGRRLASHLRRGKRLKKEYDRRSHIEKYLPHIGIALQEILEFSDAERLRTVEALEAVLQRERGH